MWRDFVCARSGGSGRVYRWFYYTGARWALSIPKNRRIFRKIPETAGTFSAPLRLNLGGCSGASEKFFNLHHKLLQTFSAACAIMAYVYCGCLSAHMNPRGGERV